jgi:hypothetical protein
LALGILFIVATTIQLSSLVHAIFYLTMISEFGSLDEMVCWLDSLGSRQALPAQLFILGLIVSIMSVLPLMFAIFPSDKAGIIITCSTVTFGIGHISVLRALQDYYDAVHKVSNGWRLSQRGKLQIANSKRRKKDKKTKR